MHLESVVHNLKQVIDLYYISLVRGRGRDLKTVVCSEEFCHRAELDSVWVVCIQSPSRVPDHRPGRHQVCRHPGQGELVVLSLRERPPELFPHLEVVPGQLQAVLGSAQGGAG